MKKIISVVALSSILAAGSAFASGYRIPEQSADSTAKSGANVAGALGPDAAYYNPANMAWMEHKGWIAEAAASYIHLTEIDYDDARTSAMDDSSSSENFFLPTFFMVSPDYNDFRVGVSLTAPFGLAKRWPDGFGRTFAEKFSLKVIEFTQPFPTISVTISPWVVVSECSTVKPRS